MISRISNWWGTYQWKRRWRRIYREAVRVDGVANLHLSVCEPTLRPKIIESCKDTWNRIPSDVRTALEQHWDRLQKSWDRRQIGVPLHLPIFGVFDDGIATAPDFGRIIGRAMVARGWNGFGDTGPSLLKLFSGVFLPLWPYQTELAGEQLNAAVAARFASYYLWIIRDRAGESEYITRFHLETWDLAAKWGFQEADS